MSESQTWAEALNIKPESLTEWSAQAPEGKPLLVHCLEQGLIALDDYLEWAKENFGLPVLQTSYFQMAFDPNFLEQARLNGEWQPWCFPIEQWDGVTFVACVEPPSAPASDLRYVLADPRPMLEAWGVTMTTVRPVKASNKAPLPELPDAHDEPPALIESEMPAGLSVAPQPFKLDLGDEATFHIGPVTEIKPAPTAPPEEASIHLADADAFESPAIPPMVAAAPPNVVAAAPLNVVPAAPAKTDGKASTVATRHAADENVAIQTTFNSLRTKYAGALVMQCSNDTARLYQWDSSLRPVNDPQKISVNLSYPTFLRIVAKTNLPYHGYLVDSPAHREFFQSIGIHALPTCVTAVPVRFDTRLWGMVVAFGGEENQKMEFLTFAQEQTERLINAVYDSWSKAS